MNKIEDEKQFAITNVCYERFREGREEFLREKSEGSTDWLIDVQIASMECMLLQLNHQMREYEANR